MSFMVWNHNQSKEFLHNNNNKQTVAKNSPLRLNYSEEEWAKTPQPDQRHTHLIVAVAIQEGRTSYYCRSEGQLVLNQ